MKSSSSTSRYSAPMPLWLQGIVELVFTAALSFGLVLALLVAVWLTNGFDRMDFPAIATLASHLWLLMHGVPLNIPGAFGIILPHGMLTLVPLGLSIIPVLLCFRSGRKLARASYEGEFFKPALAGSLAYGVFAGVVFTWASTERHLMGIVGAVLIPQIVVLVGLIWGGYYESRSLARMVGVDTAEQISRMSQYSRWASSYVYSVVRASVVAVFALIMGGALVLALAMMMRWSQIATIYQELHAGPVGALAVTLLQLGYLPNLVVYAMSWSTGAGFSFGEGTHVGYSQTAMGDLPLFPVLGAIPESLGWVGYLGLAVSLGAGAVAGWWFLREGEDHVEEWLTMKVRYRVIALPLSSAFLGLWVGLFSGVWAFALGWVSSGSLGVGRFTQVGASPAAFAVSAALTLGVGTAVGNLLCHILLPDSSSELPRFADERPNLGSRMSEMIQQRREALAERTQHKNDEEEHKAQEQEERMRDRAQKRQERAQQLRTRRAELNKFAEQEEAQWGRDQDARSDRGEEIPDDAEPTVEITPTDAVASDSQSRRVISDGVGSEQAKGSEESGSKSSSGGQEPKRGVKPGKREKAPGQPVYVRASAEPAGGQDAEKSAQAESEQSSQSADHGEEDQQDTQEPGQSEQESQEDASRQKRQLTPSEAMDFIFGAPAEDSSGEAQEESSKGKNKKKK